MANAKSITKAAKALAEAAKAVEVKVETIIIKIVDEVEHDGERLIKGEHYEIEASAGTALVAAKAATIPAVPVEAPVVLAPAPAAPAEGTQTAT